MKELSEASGDRVMNSYDGLTGMCLLMLNVMGNYHDLSAVYDMMKIGPETNSLI